jgi:hypothetical protein
MSILSDALEGTKIPETTGEMLAARDELSLQSQGDFDNRELLEKILRAMNALPNYRIPRPGVNDFKETYEIASTIDHLLRPR